MDRLIRSEHSKDDSLELRSCTYYKNVLLARQAELRGLDLQGNEALLLEWYTLIKELDFVVRQQSLMALRNERAIDDLLREGQVSPHEYFDVPGGTNYTSASKRRPIAVQKKEDPPEAAAAAAEDTQEPPVNAAAAAITSETSPASALAAASMQAQAVSTEPVASEAFAMDTAAHVAGQDEPTAGVGDVVEGCESKMTLEDYALMPPGARFKTLVSPTTDGADKGDGVSAWKASVWQPSEDGAAATTSEKEADLASFWVPPTLDDIEQGDLPSWLLEDDEFMRELLEEAPTWDDAEVDVARISEADLKRQIAEKDEEIRLTKVKLEIDSSKRQLEGEKAALNTMTDAHEAANMNMELIERELELECKEKELLADELKQDLRDLDEELGKAKLGLLQHPQIGEMVDRANLLEALGQGALDESRFEAPQSGSLVLDTRKAQDTPMVPDKLAHAQQDILTDSATLNSIGGHYRSLREQSIKQAALDGRTGDSMQWHDEQMEGMRIAAAARSQQREEVKSVLQEANATKETRAEAFQHKAQKETVKQIKAVEQRARTAQQMLLEDQQRRDASQKAAFENHANGSAVESTTKQIAEWSKLVTVLKSHLEKRIEAMNVMNKMTVKLTGAKAIALNDYEQLSDKTTGRVRRWRLKEEEVKIGIPADEDDEFNEDDWM